MASIWTELQRKQRRRNLDSDYREDAALRDLNYILSAEKDIKIEERAAKREQRTDITTAQQNISDSLVGFDLQLSDPEMTRNELTKLTKMLPNYIKQAKTHYIKPGSPDELPLFLQSMETAFGEKLSRQESVITRKENMASIGRQVGDLVDADAKNAGKYQLNNTLKILESLEGLNEEAILVNSSTMLKSVEAMKDEVTQSEFIVGELNYFFNSPEGKKKVTTFGMKNSLDAADRAFKLGDMDEAYRQLTSLSGEKTQDERTALSGASARSKQKRDDFVEAYRKPFALEMDMINTILDNKVTRDGLGEFESSMQMFSSIPHTQADFALTSYTFGKADLAMRDVLTSIRNADKWSVFGDALEGTDILTDEDIHLYLSGIIYPADEFGNWMYADHKTPYLVNDGKGNFTRPNKYGEYLFNSEAYAQQIKENLKRIDYGGGGDNTVQAAAIAAASRAWLLLNPDVQTRQPKVGKGKSYLDDAKNLTVKDAHVKTAYHTGRGEPITQAKNKFDRVFNEWQSSLSNKGSALHKSLNKEMSKYLVEMTSGDRYALLSTAGRSKLRDIEELLTSMTPWKMGKGYGLYASNKNYKQFKDAWLSALRERSLEISLPSRD